jgi:cytochrome b involved in lipid metabolism
MVIFEGSVYDIDTFLPTHPGGSEKIDEYLGKNIDKAFEEAEHSKHARLIFRDLERVGVIEGEVNDTKSRKKAPMGLDGYELKSNLNLDYSKGLYW